MDDFVKLLGVRGSSPVSGAEFARYGGATCCVLLQLAGQALLLDAGSGMLQWEGADGTATPLLLSHAHADHLLGLLMCPALLEPEGRLDVYAAARGGLDAGAQVRTLMAPPLWPVGPEQLPADIRFFELPEQLAIGPLAIRTMEGRHSGGVSLFSIRGGGRHVVYISDCTLWQSEKLTEFAAGCDLLLCDGQYSPQEWSRFGSFGHSTWEMAAEFGARCGAGHTCILHHAPWRTDDQLDRAADSLARRYPSCTFGREGEVFWF